MGTSLLLLILSAGLQVRLNVNFQNVSCFQKYDLQQVSALPRTLILLLLFLTAFVWISAILMLIMAARLKWIYWDVAQSFSLRLAITVFTIILVYSVGQMNVVGLSLNSLENLLMSGIFPQFTCLSDSPCKSNFTSDSINSIDDADSHRRCVSFNFKTFPSISTMNIISRRFHNTFHCPHPSDLCVFPYS